MHCVCVIIHYSGLRTTVKSKTIKLSFQKQHFRSLSEEEIHWWCISKATGNAAKIDALTPLRKKTDDLCQFLITVQTLLPFGLHGAVLVIFDPTRMLTVLGNTIYSLKYKYICKHTHMCVCACICVYVPVYVYMCLFDSLFVTRQFAVLQINTKMIKIGYFMQGDQHDSKSRREEDLF